jgi:hypothetical protein
MSRELPARPNLEFLKKQAKELLRELQQSKPDTRLSDAQHVLAREYGFASWPALHARVERIVSAPDGTGREHSRLSAGKMVASRDGCDTRCRRTAVR